MDFIHEQDIARLEIGEQCRQVARTLEDGAGSLAQIHLQFIGDDIRQRGLAETRGPENQHMVQRLAALPRRLDEDCHLILDVRLPDVVGESSRPHSPVDHFVVAAAGACNDAILFDTHR